MSQLAMIVDYGYCTNCYSCEVSCSKGKGLPLDEWGIKITEFGPHKLGGEWEWDYVAVPSRLCDLCKDRVAEGNKALCELHCIANAIEVVPLEDVSKRMAEFGRGKVACFIPQVVEI